MREHEFDGVESCGVFRKRCSQEPQGQPVRLQGHKDRFVVQTVGGGRGRHRGDRFKRGQAHPLTSSLGGSASDRRASLR